MTHCAEHGQRPPCTSCAADHLVGAHQAGSRLATCPRCEPTPAPPAEIDAAALAAADDTLTDPNEETRP